MNTEKNHPEETSNIDDLFEQAARNQGFANLQELIEVTSWLSNEIDPASIASNMDDPASAPMMPKPEFKAQFEAWQKRRFGEKK